LKTLLGVDTGPMSERLRQRLDRKARSLRASVVRRNVCEMSTIPVTFQEWGYTKDLRESRRQAAFRMAEFNAVQGGMLECRP
jgi:hypothetical protein